MFNSFWMGGFEAACHINPHGERLDMIAGTQHDVQAQEDYAMLSGVGIRTVRDAARWHLIEQAGTYDFGSFLPMLKAAHSTGTQVIWTLCHYGWPKDIDILSPAFIDRFAKFSAAVARIVREQSDEVPFYTPVNEISFFSWGASRDLIYPYAVGKDNELKHQLVRAAVASCEAILQVDPRARFVHPEPAIHVVTPRDRPEIASDALSYNEAQYEAWDMLAGRMMPELGGDPKYLDIVGLNYYHSNQWEHTSGRLRWEDEPRDPRWLPFRELVRSAWNRYERPVVISETSHFGVGRARWIREIGREVYEAIRSGVPVEGICLYPVLDRYDWGDRNHWHNSGLYDLVQCPDGRLGRTLNPEYGEALQECQELLATVGKR